MQTRFADMGEGHSQDFFEAPLLVKLLAIVAERYREAWKSLDDATQEARKNLPDEYDSLAYASLETWRVWQSFEVTAAHIETQWIKQEQDNPLRKLDR